MDKLTPYVVKLSKTIERYVIIYSENSAGIADVAQAMCASEKIELGNDDDFTTEALVIGEADEDDIERLDGYAFSFEKIPSNP